MKKLILSAIMVAGMAVTSFGQGTILMSVGDNTDTSPTATSGGLFFDASLQLLAVDSINMQLLGGSSAGSLSSVGIYTDGSVVTFGPGIYVDGNGTEFPTPGVPLNTPGFFQVRVWLGAEADWATAVANGEVRGESTVFANPTGGALPAPTLTGMPAVVLVPEPGTFALAGLGMAALMAIRRRK